MTRKALALWPREGLFLKDGRGWYTSDVGKSHAHAWPYPPTIRGALRARYGHAYMAEHDVRLGREQWRDMTAALAIERLLTVRREHGQALSAQHRMWPTPADAAYRVDGEGQRFTQRLAPEKPRGQAHSLDGEDMQSLWRAYPPSRGKPAARPGFWPEQTMMDWLYAPADPGKEQAEILGHDPVQRTDVHVTITAETQTATQSMLFVSHTTETLTCDGDRDAARWHEWGMLVDCQVPGEVASFPGGVVTVGGRRRLVAAEDIDEDLFAAPADVGGDSQGLRLILATPGHFEHGWLPDGFAFDADKKCYVGQLPGLDEPVELRGFMAGRPLALSTWDMAERAPRKTWRLVPPGSVYFFARHGDKPFTADERRAMWLARLGMGTQDGFGQVLPGVWNMESTKRG